MIGEKESPDVDPSTICQYTGLTDCEGNEIWEGDMLSNVTNDSPDGIVVFKYGAFCLLAKNGRDFCVALTYLLSEKESLNRFKVIGNKFDKERMKKQIVLDEQDIEEFHEDAKHLRWLYNRMACEHGEQRNLDYMHRFAKIINKLELL
jgi:hypothetical protein